MATKRKARGKPRTSGRAGSSALRGGRKKGQPSPQEVAIAAVARVLEHLEEPAAVIGGIAVISYGFARLTNDIDCAVSAPREAATRLLQAFQARGFSPRRKDAIAFAEERTLGWFDELMSTDRLGDWRRLRNPLP